MSEMTEAEVRKLCAYLIEKDEVMDRLVRVTQSELDRLHKEKILLDKRLDEIISQYQTVFAESDKKYSEQENKIKELIERVEEAEKRRKMMDDIQAVAEE